MVDKSHSLGEFVVSCLMSFRLLTLVSVLTRSRDSDLGLLMPGDPKKQLPYIRVSASAPERGTEGANYLEATNPANVQTRPGANIMLEPVL